MAVTITNIEYVPFNVWSVEKNISSHISNIFTSPYGQSLAEPGKITITLSNGVYKNEACNEVIDISSISFLDYDLNTHPHYHIQGVVLSGSAESTVEISFTYSGTEGDSCMLVINGFSNPSVTPDTLEIVRLEEYIFSDNLLINHVQNSTYDLIFRDDLVDNDTGEYSIEIVLHNDATDLNSNYEVIGGPANRGNIFLSTSNGTVTIAYYNVKLLNPIRNNNERQRVLFSSYSDFLLLANENNNTDIIDSITLPLTTANGSIIEIKINNSIINKIKPLLHNTPISSKIHDIFQISSDTYGYRNLGQYDKNTYSVINFNPHNHFFKTQNGSVEYTKVKPLHGFSNLSVTPASDGTQLFEILDTDFSFIRIYPDYNEAFFGPLPIKILKENLVDYKDEIITISFNAIDNENNNLEFKLFTKIGYSFSNTNTFIDYTRNKNTDYLAEIIEIPEYIDAANTTTRLKIFSKPYIDSNYTYTGSDSRVRNIKLENESIFFQEPSHVLDYTLTGPFEETDIPGIVDGKRNYYYLDITTSIPLSNLVIGFRENHDGRIIEYYKDQPVSLMTSTVPTVTTNCTLKANAYSYLRPTDTLPSTTGSMTVTFNSVITKVNGTALDKDNFILGSEDTSPIANILSVTSDDSITYILKFTGLNQDFRLYQNSNTVLGISNAFNAGLPIDPVFKPVGVFTDYFDTYKRYGDDFDGIIRVKNVNDTGIVFEYNGMIETTYIIEPEDIIFDSNRDIQFTNTLAYPINTDTTIGTITSTYTNKRYSEVYGIKAKLTLNTGEKVELVGNTLVKISSDEQSEPALWITVKKKPTDIDQHGNISIEFTSPVSKSNGGGDIDYTNFVFSGLDPNTEISAGPASGNNRIVNIKVSQLNEYVDPLNPDNDIVITTTGINLAFSGGNGGTYGIINGPIIIKYRDLFELTTTPPLERVTVNVGIFKINKANAYQAIDTVPYKSDFTSSEGYVVISFDKPINKLDGTEIDSSNFEFTGTTGFDNNGIRIISYLKQSESSNNRCMIWFSGYNQDFRSYINNPLTLTLKDVMSGNAPVLLDYNNNSNVKLYSDYFSTDKPTDYIVTVNETLSNQSTGEICFRVEVPGEFVDDSIFSGGYYKKLVHDLIIDNVILTNSNNSTFTVKSLNKDKFYLNTPNDSYFEFIVKEDLLANTDITNIVINGKFNTGEDLVINKPITYSINNTVLSASMVVNDRLSPYVSTDTGEFTITTTLPISSIDDTPVTFNNFEFSKTSDDKEWFTVQSFNAVDTQNFKFVIKYIKHNNLTVNYNETVTITIKDIKVIN